MNKVTDELNEIKELLEDINQTRINLIKGKIDYLNSVFISQEQNEEDYVLVDLNIPPEDLLVLAIEAHNADMKLNDFIVEILKKNI